MSCLYILDINPLLYHLQIFSVIQWVLPFHFVDCFLCCAKAFTFNQVPFICFWFFCLRTQILKKYHYDLCQSVFCLHPKLKRFKRMSSRYMCWSCLHLNFSNLNIKRLWDSWMNFNMGWVLDSIKGLLILWWSVIKWFLLCYKILLFVLYIFGEIYG